MICPYVGESRNPSGFPKLAWLSRLNASDRNWSPYFSVSAKRFIKPASMLKAPGPVIAASDWMRAVPDLIRPWVPTDFHTLGTDGFGLSDTRPAVRRHFAVDAESITVQALAALLQRGELDRNTLISAASKYRIDDPRAAAPPPSDPGSA